MRQVTLTACIENLEAVMDFVTGELDRVACPAAPCMAVMVAVEELFVNIAHYAYAPKSGPVTIQADVNQQLSLVTLVFMDAGVAYNPLSRPDPAITGEAGERKIGGLGIFMVKKSMDQVSYRYENGLNILTMSKRWA